MTRTVSKALDVDDVCLDRSTRGGRKAWAVKSRKSGLTFIHFMAEDYPTKEDAEKMLSLLIGIYNKGHFNGFARGVRHVRQGLKNALGEGDQCMPLRRMMAETGDIEI